MRFNRFLHWKFRRKRCGVFLMLAIILSMIFMGIEFHKDWDDKKWTSPSPDICFFDKIILAFLKITRNSINCAWIFLTGKDNFILGDSIYSLAIFRERWDELQKMVPALHGFLADQGIIPEYIVVNQTDPFRFNRAALINIGSIEAEKIGCDYMAIHDVDLGWHFLSIQITRSFSSSSESEFELSISHGKHCPFGFWKIPSYFKVKGNQINICLWNSVGRKFSFAQIWLQEFHWRSFNNHSYGL